MDKKLGDICVFSDSLQKSIDLAVWRNFLITGKNLYPCFVIDGLEDNYACVSKDVLQHFHHQTPHQLPNTYSGMDYNHIASICRDHDPLDHWVEIKGMISVTDHRVLRFILEKKIPIEKFIRHELASTGFDENGVWCGIDKSKEIWLK